MDYNSALTAFLASGKTVTVLPARRGPHARKRVKVTGYGVVRQCSDEALRTENRKMREDYIIGHQVEKAQALKVRK